MAECAKKESIINKDRVLLRITERVVPAMAARRKTVEVKNIQSELNGMEEEKLLLPQDLYLKSGIHIGTKFRTKYMAPFIYKTRPDGLSVLNLQKIDERLGLTAKLLSRYRPEDIVVVSRRENSWTAVKMFGKVTGCRVFAGRYPPGILTNPGLSNFIEAKLLFATDPWPDKNAVKDALDVGMPIIALCDTNNTANNVDLVIPCNNKGRKSLALIFFVLAREMFKARGEEVKFTEADFGFDSQ